MVVIAQAMVVVVVVVVAAWSRGMTGTPRRPESITHIESSFRIIAGDSSHSLLALTDIRVSSTLFR